MPVLLHVGCGQNRKAQTTRGFQAPEWTEVRLDIDPNVEPDIVGTMTDMAGVADESVDAVFSSHNIEHLYAHETSTALGEFRRVLKPDGFLVITCPDLQSVAALVAQDKLGDPAYMSPAGPITPHDMLYGLGAAMARGNLFMAHRSGFTGRTLLEALRGSGFGTVAATRRPTYFDLWAVAAKSPRSDEAIRALAQAHFPRTAG